MIVLSAICLTILIWILFLIPYHLWLRNTTLFIGQRLYLYCALMMGTFLGILFYYFQSVDSGSPPILDAILLNRGNTGLSLDLNYHELIESHTFLSTFQAIVIISYFTGSLFLLGKLIFHIYEIFRLAQYYSISQEGKQRIVETTDSHTPFTFFRLIFFSREYMLNESDRKIIYAHERIHSKQLHSIDIILCELLFVVSWFLPIVLWYKHYFNETHEWAADAAVSRQIPLSVYGTLLINQSLGDGMPITHRFSSGELKSRILKMKQRRSGKWNYSVFGVLPVLAFLSINFFSIIKIHSDPVSVNRLNEKTHELVYLNLENGFTIIPEGQKVRPTPVAIFPSGNIGLERFFDEHLDISSLNLKEKTTVTLRLYIDHTGAIANMSILETCPESLKKVLKSAIDKMPSWIPPSYRGHTVSSTVLIPLTLQ